MLNRQSVVQHRQRTRHSSGKRKMRVESLESRAMLSATPLQLDLDDVAVTQQRKVETATEQASTATVAASATKRNLPLIHNVQALQSHDDVTLRTRGMEPAPDRCCFNFPISHAHPFRTREAFPIGFAVTVRRPLFYVSPALASHRADLHRATLDQLIGQWHGNHESHDHVREHHAPKHHAPSGYTGISHAFASTGAPRPTIKLIESPLSGAEGEPPDPLPPLEQSRNGSSDGGFLELTLNDTPAVMRYDTPTGIKASLSLMPGANSTPLPSSTAMPNIVEPGVETMNSVNDGTLAEKPMDGANASSARFAGQNAETRPPTETHGAPPVSQVLQTPVESTPVDGQIVDGIVTRLFEGDLSRFLNARGHEFWQLELDRLGVDPEALPPAPDRDPTDVPEVAADPDVIPGDNSDKVAQAKVEPAELPDGGAVDLLSFDQLAIATMANHPESLVPDVAPLTIDARLGFYRSIELASADHESTSLATKTAMVSTYDLPIAAVDTGAEFDVPNVWNLREWSRWVTTALVISFVCAIRQPRETRSKEEPLRRFLGQLRKRRP